MFEFDYWRILEWVGVGGISTLATLKIGIKSAKTDLMSKMQSIYGKIIEDLREELGSFKSRIGEMEDNICYRKDCKTREK